MQSRLKKFERHAGNESHLSQWSRHIPTDISPDFRSFVICKMRVFYSHLERTKTLFQYVLHLFVEMDSTSNVPFSLKRETCTVVETPIVHKSLPFGGIKFYEENRRQTGRSEDNLSSNLFFFFSFPRSSGSHNLS